MASKQNEAKKAAKREAARKAAKARVDSPKTADKPTKTAKLAVRLGDRARAADAIAFDVRGCTGVRLVDWYAYTDGGGKRAYTAIVAHCPNPTETVAGFAIGATEPTQHARVEALALVLGRYAKGVCCVTPAEADLVLEAVKAVPADALGYAGAARLGRELKNTINKGRSKAYNAESANYWAAKYDWQHTASSKRWAAMQAAAAARVAS